jgi:hypothetical protein
MADRPVTEPTEIEITPAMIDAAGRVLRADPFCQLPPTIAEIIAEEMLRAALVTRASGSSQDAHKSF